MTTSMVAFGLCCFVAGMFALALGIVLLICWLEVSVAFWVVFAMVLVASAIGVFVGLTAGEAM